MHFQPSFGQIVLEGTICTAVTMCASTVLVHKFLPTPKLINKKVINEKESNQ